MTIAVRVALVVTLSALGFGEASAFPKPKYPTRLEDLPANRTSAPEAPVEVEPLSPPSGGQKKSDASANRDSARKVPPGEGAGATIGAATQSRSRRQVVVAKSSADKTQADKTQADKTQADKTQAGKIEGVGTQADGTGSDPVSRGPVASKQAAPAAAAVLTYVAAPGDTVSGVARRFGVSPASVVSANTLGPDPKIRAGQVLMLPPKARDSGKDPFASGPPPRTASAPPVTPQAALDRQSAERPKPTSVVTSDPHTTATDQAPTRTLKPTGISSRSKDTAAAAPGSTPAAGPTLNGATLAGASAALSSRASSSSAPPSSAPPSSAPSSPPPVGSGAALAAVKPAMTSPPDPSAGRKPPLAFGDPTRTPPPPLKITPSPGLPPAAQIRTLGQGRFVWPLKGAVVSPFGPQGAGLRNEGLNIAASRGTAVRAASAGEVVYAGNAIPGYGNLILMKHADGWVTAYGHLDSIKVRMRDRVEQGQEIGAVGDSGGAGEPQLHFEVRYAPTPTDKARPVDPALVLP